MGELKQIPADDESKLGRFSTNRELFRFVGIGLLADGTLILFGLALWKWAIK